MIRLLDKLLLIEKEERSFFEVIGWWEIRRILYNLIVFGFGVISLLFISFLIDIPPGEDIQEPITIVVFAVLCNAFYTFGWISELVNRNIKNYGPKYFKIGLGFTLFWVMLPVVIHMIWWVLRGFTVYSYN